MDALQRSQRRGGRAMADAHASRLTAWAPGRHPRSSDGGSRRPFRYIARPMDRSWCSNVLVPIDPSLLADGFGARDVSHEDSALRASVGKAEAREHGAERCAASLPSRDRFTFHADLTLGTRLGLTCGDHTRGQERPRAARRAGRGGIVSTARCARRPHDAGPRFASSASSRACDITRSRSGWHFRAAARGRRQTARHGERSIRLRCSCLCVCAFAEPFVVARRLSAGRDA